MLQASEFRMHVVVLLFSLGGFGLSSSSATELSGELTDPQGHVVPDASVRMLRRADATVRETHTDPSGQFTFTQHARAILKAGDGSGLTG